MLTGAQKGQLLGLILESFDPNSFRQLMVIRLDKEYYNYAAPSGTFKDQVFDIIQAAENEVWESDLLLALLAERPKKRTLVDFVAGFQLSPSNLYQDIPANKLTKNALEALVNADPVLPGYVFIARLLESMQCVCRIETVNSQGEPLYGTGFLIGPDLVLTNYHILEAVIKNPALVASVTCKFDYYIRPDGIVSTGMDVVLANMPIIASSTYGDYDVNGTASVNVNWPVDKLDYALARIARKLGDEPFGIKAENAAADAQNRRGWIKAAGDPVQFLQQGGNVIIIQHPSKEPIKVAIGLGKVNGCDQKGLRVRYSVNTIEGSSGSPCFNKDFQWTALHNMGDPNWIPTYNQGIPADKIINDLANKGITLSN